MESFKIKEKIYDAILYISPALTQFPKSEKYVLANKIRESAYKMFELSVRIEKKYYKKTTLQDADIQLELLRIFNDLSYDLKFIDEKRYLLISDRLCEIGRLLGGWIKSQKEKS